MPETTIDGLFDSPIPVYANIDTANKYLEAAFHADSWNALEGTEEDETKAKLLVTATRILDRQLWAGTKTAEPPTQTLQWPRTNTGVDGVTDDTIPTDIINASIELALSLLDGSEVQNEQNTLSKVRSMTAGSVSITNFRGIEEEMRFPLIVTELIDKYLAGGSTSSTTFAPKAVGVDEETIFPVEVGFGTGGL